MTQQRFIEFMVGIFIVATVIAFLLLALKVGGLVQTSKHGNYYVQANFDNIGDLKVRAPVTIAGIKIGEVSDIELNPGRFNATVTLKISGDQTQIPEQDTTAIILTEGLLGSNYISIVPGYNYDDEDQGYLKDGEKIQQTQPALILENLIGQFMFNINN